jgi:hypothetical protein
LFQINKKRLISIVFSLRLEKLNDDCQLLESFGFGGSACAQLGEEGREHGGRRVGGLGILVVVHGVQFVEFGQVAQFLVD